MISVNRRGLTFYRFESLAACPGLMHGVFTRHGGSSAPPFASLNISTGAGDDPAAVAKNRQAIAACFNHARLAFVKQVHRTGIRVLKKDRTVAFSAGQEPEGDALVSDRPGLLLGIKLADCQSIILFDPRQKVAANVHSGWRGSVANIIGRTVAVMTETFQCRPADILAGISPSLGPCCAEFVNYKTEIPTDLWAYKDAHHRFDFWQISRDQLTAAGLLADNIEIAGICTRCHKDRFFSYRAEGRTGRFATVAGILNKNT